MRGNPQNCTLNFPRPDRAGILQRRRKNERKRKQRYWYFFSPPSFVAMGNILSTPCSGNYGYILTSMLISWSLTSWSRERFSLPLHPSPSWACRMMNSDEGNIIPALEKALDEQDAKGLPPFNMNSRRTYWKGWVVNPRILGVRGLRTGIGLSDDIKPKLYIRRRKNVEFFWNDRPNAVA